MANSEMGTSSLTLEEAATIVCRNPEHIDQAKALLKESAPLKEEVMDVDSLVRHWWDNQLFLSIKLN